MGKIIHIILILFVSLIFNSCAEIDRSSENFNSKLTEQIRPSYYGILAGTELKSYNNLFSQKQILSKKSEDPILKSNNIFLFKKNYFGNIEWIMDLGMSNDESEISMTFDSSKNFYRTEYTRNRLAGNINSGDFTVFLVKYNSSGIREWIKKLGKSEFENGARIISDFSDNVYVAGFSSEFDPENKFRHRKPMLAKYDPSGNRKWTTSLGSTSSYFAWDVTVDSTNNIYLTGFSQNSVLQKISKHDDIILIKFNSDGIKL